MEAIAEKLQDLLVKYQTVEAALKLDPRNADLKKAKNELEDVITQLQDLYEAEKAKAGLSSSSSSSSRSVTSSSASSSSSSSSSSSNGDGAGLPLRYPVGTQIEAIYNRDRLWYPAMIDGIDKERGLYHVTFIGYNNKQFVRPEETRPCLPSATTTTTTTDTASTSTSTLLTEEPVLDAATATTTATTDAAAAGKKKKRKELPIPKSLKILPTDSEEEKQRKKRKVKNIKSKNRLMKAEEARDSKKNTWKKFESSSKNKKKVPGFISGIRKESIFKSPDSVTGKVGVTGSGAAMTPQPEDLRFKYKKKAAIPLPKELGQPE